MAEHSKQRAIVSFLWDNQKSVIHEFRRIEPDVAVITPGGKSDDGTIVDFVRQYERVSAPELLARLAAEKDRIVGAYAGSLADVGVDAAAFERSFSGLLPWNVAADSLGLRAALDLVDDDYDVLAVIVSEDMTPQGKTIARWARDKKIPCIHLCHAIPLVNPYTVHAEFTADTIAVYGMRAAESYVDVGVAAEKVAVVGNPAWDIYCALREQRVDIRRQVGQKYGLDASAKTLLFATTWAANLSALVEPEIHVKTLLTVLKTYKVLLSHGVKVELVIKDRPSNADFGVPLLERAIETLEMGDCRIIYAYEDGPALVTAADAVVAVDSNMLVEAMHVGVPAINLMNDTGLLMGPCFEEETGIAEVDGDALADVLHAVLTNPDIAARMSTRHLERVAHYNVGANDAGSAQRTAMLLKNRMRPPAGPRPGGYVWERFLKVEDTAVVDLYHNTGRAPLVAMFERAPKIAMDVGCAAGANAVLIKERFPGCAVWGVETNRHAAAMATTRIDRVLTGRLDEFDLEKEGLKKGALDAVLFADVLEHMYDPWHALTGLHEYLADDGEVVVSIPNVRNLLVINGLTAGHWKYEEQGIMDITHVRFFTLSDFTRLAHETGYVVDKVDFIFDARLANIFQSTTKFPTEVSGDRFVMKGIGRQELAELCSLQFYFRLKKRMR